MAFAPSSSARVSLTFLLDKVSPALNDAAIESFAAATQAFLVEPPVVVGYPVVTLVKSTTTNTATRKNIITKYFTYNVTVSAELPHFAADTNFPDTLLDPLYDDYANPAFLGKVVDIIMSTNPSDPILANLANAIVDTNSFNTYLDPVAPAEAAESKKKEDLAVPLGVGLGLPLGIILVVAVLYFMHTNNMLGDKSAKPPSKNVEMSAGHHVQVATGDNHGHVNEI